MTIIELKDILTLKIAAISDKSFLAAINTFLDVKYEKLIYKLTPEQKQEIKESQEQSARGEVISNDQLEKEINKWLCER